MALERFSSDESYLRRLAVGVPETECHFVRYFSPLLRAKLQSRLRGTQEVDDLKQEVFLRVLQTVRKGPGLRDSGKLAAFVNSVCDNVLLEHIRSRSRVSQWDSEITDSREISDDLDGRVLWDEVREQMWSVMNTLPPRDRKLLCAVFIDEQDKDTVCLDYGVHRGHLRVLLHRAKRNLRDLLVHVKPSAKPIVRAAGGTGIFGEYHRNIGI